jgi:hypothetical protein
VIASSLKLCARYIRNIGHNRPCNTSSICVYPVGGWGGEVQDRFSKRNHVCLVWTGMVWRFLMIEMSVGRAPWLLYVHVNLVVCEINSNCSAEAVSIHYSSTRRHLCKTRRHARSVTYYFPPAWVTHPLIIDSLTGGWKFMQLKTLNHIAVVAVCATCCTIQKLCILSTHDDCHKQEPLFL